MNHLIVDSGCDVTAELVEHEGCMLSRVPLNLQVEDTVYVDDDNIDLNKYLAHMEASPIAVKTSAPSPSLFTEKFKLGDNVFVVTLSSKLSATYQSALAAKDMYLEEYGKKFIHVFDSFSAAIAEGVIAMKISELSKIGTGATEIVEQVNTYIENMRTFFILDKFDNLVKTGRVNPYVAKVASVLNIKPVCTEEGGQIKMVDKSRGFPKALARMMKLIETEVSDIEQRVIGITHVQAYEKALATKEALLAHFKPRDIVIIECRGITTTYANRGGVILAL
ncbi:MAG: DegV family protein [Defluviitaleaceae bacterium]|nr:DegV family protein [Defluviitaleaceae bacterium]